MWVVVTNCPLPSLSYELDTVPKNSGKGEATLAQITQNQRTKEPPSPNKMANTRYTPPMLASPLRCTLELRHLSSLPTPPLCPDSRPALPMQTGDLYTWAGKCIHLTCHIYLTQLTCTDNKTAQASTAKENLSLYTGGWMPLLGVGHPHGTSSQLCGVQYIRQRTNMHRIIYCTEKSPLHLSYRKPKGKLSALKLFPASVLKGQQRGGRIKIILVQITL